MIGLDQEASIYTPDSDGDYTVLDISGLACRLAHIAPAAGAPAMERADLVTMRRFIWGTDYTMPDSAQILVENKRWNIEPNTVEGIRGVTGSVEYQRCAVVVAI